MTTIPGLHSAGEQAQDFVQALYQLDSGSWCFGVPTEDIFTRREKKASFLPECLSFSLDSRAWESSS